MFDSLGMALIVNAMKSEWWKGDIPSDYSINREVCVGSQSFLHIVHTDVKSSFVSWQILLQARKYYSKPLNKDELRYCITIATDFLNGKWLCVEVLPYFGTYNGDILVLISMKNVLCFETNT